MTAEQNDNIRAQELVGKLRGDPRPRCPQLRACRVERLYPVQGYCVQAESPGWFMIPSIEEHREYCTTPRWGDCCWFRRIGPEERTGAGEVHREEQAIRVNTWQPPDGFSRSSESEGEKTDGPPSWSGKQDGSTRYGTVVRPLSDGTGML